MCRNHHSAMPARAEPVLEAMFEARKRVFVDLLKWNVPVLGSKYEVDQFDTPDATYLILACEGGGHRASARLLPADQPHILGQLFPYLCDGPAVGHRNPRNYPFLHRSKARQGAKAFGAQSACDRTRRTRASFQDH